MSCLQSAALSRGKAATGNDLWRPGTTRRCRSAIVHRPDVIFADEPTGSLDTVSAEAVLEALVDAAESQNAALVVVTHDHRVASHLDRLVVVGDGRIVDHAMAPS